MESASDTTVAIAMPLVLRLEGRCIELADENALFLQDQRDEEQHQVEDGDREERSRPARLRRVAQTVAPPGEENGAEQSGPDEVAALFDAERNQQKADRHEAKR